MICYDCGHELVAIQLAGKLLKTEPGMPLRREKITGYRCDTCEVQAAEAWWKQQQDRDRQLPKGDRT